MCKRNKPYSLSRSVGSPIIATDSINTSFQQQRFNRASSTFIRTKSLNWNIDALKKINKHNQKKNYFILAIFLFTIICISISVILALKLPQRISTNIPECALHVLTGVPSTSIYSINNVHHQIQSYLTSITTSTSTLNNVIVCLEQGVHTLVSPLILSQENTIKNSTRSVNILFRSEPFGSKAIVTGGTQLTTWNPALYVGENVYVSSYVSNITVRNFWVQGMRARRAIIQSSISTLFGTLTTFEPANGGVGYIAERIPTCLTGIDINATNAIEFTYGIVIKNWIQPRCTVASINGLNITLSTECGIHLRSRAEGNAIPPPATMEALPNIALSPGMFYYDQTNGLLYYNLAPTQTINDLQTNAWVPTLETFVIHNASSNIAWQGITFAYSTWSQPNRVDGYVDLQSAVFECTNTAITPNCFSGSAEPVAAVETKSSTNISFVGCTFVNIGCPYALKVAEGSKNIQVIGNTFNDLSGGWLSLGNVVNSGAVLPNPNAWDSNAIVSNNIAGNMSIEFQGAASLFVGYVWNATISQNTISDAGYSGISVGWGWGKSHMPGYGSNNVTGNRIERVMKSLRDGGGIYVNGATSPTSLSYITKNYIDLVEAVFAVYYLDNGASYWHVVNNVASNSSLAWAFFMQGYVEYFTYIVIFVIYIFIRTLVRTILKKNLTFIFYFILFL